MEDEPTTPTPDPDEQIPDEAVPEAPPAPDPEIVRREAELAKKEKDLQRGFDEIARREQALRQSPPPADEAPAFDEPTMKALDRVLAERLAPVASENYALKQAVADAALDRYAAKSGADADALRRFAAEQRLDFAAVPADQLEEAFKVAAGYMTAQTFDPAAERERIKAEVLSELESDGVRVESVRPARAEVAGGDPDSYDDINDADERYAFVLKQLKKG